MSELVGTAIKRALRQIKPRGEISTLTDRFQDLMGFALKQEVVLLMQLEESIRGHMSACDADPGAIGTLSTIEGTLIAVEEWLKTIDTRRLAGEWLKDIDDRRRMFLALRRNEMIQARICEVLLKASS